jgi:hypothetical protein
MHQPAPKLVATPPYITHELTMPSELRSVTHAKAPQNQERRPSPQKTFEIYFMHTGAAQAPRRPYPYEL